MPSPMITPSFLLSDARYNQNLPPSSFDPNYTIDPTAAIQAQQQYLKQMFAMQNPRLALPQQFGAAIGSLLQGQAPQQQSQMPQQGPQDPAGAAIHQKAVQYGAQGLDPGAALFKAAGDIEQDPTLASDPNTQKMIEKARSYAIKTYGYNPEQEKQREFEKSKLPLDNLRLPNGKLVGAQEGTPEWKAYVAAGATKAGETPQLTPGSYHEIKLGGQYVTYQVGQDGQMKKVGTSSQPMQYQVTGSPEQMGAAGMLGQMGTTAAADKVRQELAARQTSTVNALRSIDKISDTIQNSQGSAVGTAGDWYEKGNNIVQTARNLAGNFNQQDLVDPKTYNWKGLDNVVQSVRGKAIDATKYHAQMVATAYTMAAAQSNNDTDEKMTRQRVEANLEMLAEHSDDPKAVLGTLADTRQSLKDNYNTHVSVVAPGYKSQALEDYENSRKPQLNTPEDIRAAYKAGKISKVEAKKALAAHGYQ